MILDKNYIPTEWRVTLAALQLNAPSAVMAGGCLRDLDNGRGVKDIDIFVNGDAAQHLEELRDRLVSQGRFQIAEIDTDKVYPIDQRELVGVLDVEAGPWRHALPVQIIMTSRDTSDIVNLFDFGICKIAFDGLSVTKHGDYSRDKSDQLFKLSRAREGAELEASVMRYARLSKKYAGWPFRLFDEPVEGFLP